MCRNKPQKCNLSGVYSYNVRNQNTITMDAIMFAVNEKINSAQRLMQEAQTREKFEFRHGQYLAFIEVYSLLKNADL